MALSSPRDFEKATEAAPVSLFLRSQQDEPLDGVLGWLAQRFGLDTFSTSLLGHRGRLEMKAAALVLLVVFLFDLGAWTLLFNTILEAELLKLGIWTPFAILAGLLLAGMVVLYERQFLTTDLSPGWRRLAWPTLIRFLVILGAALITAQPIELLFFRQAVIARTHEEGVRQHVATQGQHLKKIDTLLDEQKKTLADLNKRLQQEEEYARLMQAQGDLDKAQGQKAILEAQLAEATQKADFHKTQEPILLKKRDAAFKAWQAMQRRDGDGSPTEREAKRAYENAVSAYRRAVREKEGWLVKSAQYRRDLGLTGARIKILTAGHQELMEAYRRRRRELEQRIAEGTRALREEEERIKRWVRRLRELTPDELKAPVKEMLSGASRENSSFGERVAFMYQIPNYDFFEQLRVVSDLTDGCPPEWEGVSTAEKDSLGETFGLRDPEVCITGKGAAYRYSYWAIYAISLVIPLMVFATKLLMASELKTYYSAAAQAAAGNPDALLLKTIQNEVNAAAKR